MSGRAMGAVQDVWDSATVRDHVRERLEAVSDILRVRGIPVPPLEGKLLRPTLAFALVPEARRDDLDDRFWLGALAIQMVHEASLVHDDIVDGAPTRRGAPTVAADQGVGPAVVIGDHYLTGAYRAAMSVGSPEFMERFVVAVERTVAGEYLQGATVGDRVDLDTYFRAVLGKSGQLIGATACLESALRAERLARAPAATRERAVDERARALELVDAAAGLGRRLGAVYQQVDDLLDYCAIADTGKAALSDYRQRKWTWVLDIAGLDDFDASEIEVVEAVFRRDESGMCAGDRAVLFLESRRAKLIEEAGALGLGSELFESILDGWLETARTAVTAQTEALERALRPSFGHAPAARPTAEAVVVSAARALGEGEAWRAYFTEHARTFSAAARLFPRRRRVLVQGVYAYCRFTDDLVDEAEPEADVEELERRLGVWSVLSRAAFEGEHTGIALLDTVMGDARRAAVSWSYPRALLDGVRMDLRPTSYESWIDLHRYTFCVAGAVGGWMTQLFGVRDPRMLDRAHALGHGMQLTNILRDVGEDLERGRIYLPRTLLDEYRLTEDDLVAWMRGAEPLPDRYRAAMEALIAQAEEQYAWAWPGIRDLPGFFRQPVAVAAEAYRGIHDEVRRLDYDNLRARAHTSGPRKAWLGAAGVLRANMPALGSRVRGSRATEVTT